MHAHEVHTCEAHTYEVHALEMHVRKVLGSPTLQTVVWWSICRDLSCKIRVLALRDKRSLSAAAKDLRHTLNLTPSLFQVFLIHNRSIPERNRPPPKPPLGSPLSKAPRTPTRHKNGNQLSARDFLPHNLSLSLSLCILITNAPPQYP
jgi:hypothetical protein